MLNKLINFFKQISIKKLCKNFLVSNIRLVLAYNITVFLLGYSVFTPILVRFFNASPNTGLSYCASPTTGSMYGYHVRDFFSTLFGGGSHVYSGFTLGEIVLFGLVTGITIKSLGLLQEYVLPPFIRQLGFTNWYTDRELHNLALNDIRVLRAENTNIIAQVNNLSTQMHNIYNDLTININASRDSLVLLLNGVHTALSEITNENINPLHTYSFNILRQLDMMSELLRAQAEHSLSPTALRAEMERLITLYNNEHLNITNSLQSILVSLQEQASALDPNDLNQANERLQSHIAFLENVLREHSEGGNRVREAVQSQIDLVEQQIETSQQLVVLNSNSVNESGLVPSGNSGIGAPPSRPIFSGSDVVAGVSTGVMTQRMESTPNVPDNNEIIPLNDSTLQALGANTIGQYYLERRNNEIIIRLTLSGDVNVPISEMASNPITSHLAKTVTNSVTDMVVSTALTAGTSLIRGAFAGGINGFLGSMGMAPIMRIMNSPSTQRVLRQEQIEHFAKAAEVGDTVGTGLGIAKSFVKNAWWVLKNS